ncbi:DUF2155 domain-containing protein [Yoonia sp.]|uniref:DUF2155 domain-containing protein n=1 Tax=Yoonia sp. TaxID=2212373 RepID=UPI00391A5E74
MRLFAVLACLTFAAPLAAQQVVTGAGGEIRVLDRLTGDITDLTLANGQTENVGALSITLGECRYPAENVAGDGFARLIIHFRDSVTPIFSGWMLASSPALNALDHSRYDVWVLRCMTSMVEDTSDGNVAD